MVNFEIQNFKNQKFSNFKNFHEIYNTIQNWIFSKLEKLVEIYFDQTYDGRFHPKLIFLLSLVQK